MRWVNHFCSFELSSNKKLMSQYKRALEDSDFHQLININNTCDPGLYSTFSICPVFIRAKGIHLPVLQYYICQAKFETVTFTHSLDFVLVLGLYQSFIDSF